MQLQRTVNIVFVQLAEAIEQLSATEYAEPCSALANNTIGQHLRHIIELFQCLENGYHTGRLNYDERKRDKVIETNKDFALQSLKLINHHLDRPDKSLTLEVNYEDSPGEAMCISTNYYRELVYNLEHTIHHMALIRVGINQVSGIAVPESFGIASATLKFRKQCAQ